MAMDDPYRPDDMSIQSRSYIEFKLEKVDEDNLREIENLLSTQKIDSSNKGWIIEYLTTLYRKIQNIKKMEYVHEGENNENVNEYLERISSLKSRIERTN
jgi:hypothetical protein